MQPADSELWLLALELMDAYVVTIDSDYRITFINYSMTQRPRAEYIGTDVFSHMPADQALVARAAIERAFATGEKQVYDVQVRDRSLRCRVSPMSRHGRPLLAVIIAYDVTEEDRARAREKEMERRLVLSDRLASMGSLASCIAHEINNPLTYVVGNLAYVADALAQLAENDASGRCRQIQRAIGDVREGVDRVRSVVGDLSMLSQPEHDSRTMLDVRRVLESSINVAKNEIKHRARLERDYRETPLVLANESLLGQVFLNLLLNAARAIPEGSASHNAIRISTGTSEDGRATIEIRDPGSVLTPDDAAQIFETTPSQGTKVGDLGAASIDPATGRGPSVSIGLPICRTIVTGFGGEIRAESDADGGASFRIWLPCADGKDEPPLKPKSPELPPPPPMRARILVVDDEAVIASTMRRALEGHDIYVVTSGRDALELCRGEEFDLVICDLMMPDLTGMDLYEELKKDGKGAERRIIFMTGGAFTQRARRFLASVPNSWLKKPFDVEEIQMIVARSFEAREERPL
jgi:signal transduction histidine kinase/CheY-like chemotaxis protein